MHNTSKEYTNDLFNKINQSGIRYCVLRNFTHLPKSTGNSDLDILIHDESIYDFGQLIKQFTEQFKLKFVSIIKDKQSPKYCISGTNWGIQIDVFKDSVYFGNNEIIPSSILFDNTIKYNSIFVLRKEVGVLLSFLKELLNNQFCEQKYIIELQNQFNDKYIDAELLKQFTPQFISYLNSNLSHLNKKSCLRLYNLSKISFKRSKFYGLNHKIKRFFNQPGFTIVFLGTDGSGKSTVIDKISPILNMSFHKAVYYEHMRPNKIPSIATLLGKKEEFNTPVINPHEGVQSGFLGSLLRWSYYILDYIFGFYLKVWPKKAIRSCVWIFDRYYYDYLIDPKRSRIKLPQWILKLGQFLIPKPDLILCLGTDAHVIHKRKPELTLNEVERQVFELKTFCANHKKAIWIDTGQNVQTSSNEALDAIIKMMSKRFEKVVIDS